MRQHRVVFLILRLAMLFCHSSYCTMCIILTDLVSLPFYTIPISPPCNLKNFSSKTLAALLCLIHTLQLPVRPSHRIKYHDLLFTTSSTLQWWDTTNTKPIMDGLVLLSLLLMSDCLCCVPRLTTALIDEMMPKEKFPLQEKFLQVS